MSEKTIQRITQDELLTILKNVDKSTFVNIVSSTVPKMKKTGNPYFDRVKKLSSCNYLIGNSYEDRVNSNMEKEGIDGNFKTEESKVGEHVSKCVLFNERTGKYYLQYERFNEIKPQVTYVCDGQPIDKTELQPFFPPVSDTSRQEQERKVFTQTFKLDSIVEISLDGTKYIVE